MEKLGLRSRKPTIWVKTVQNAGVNTEIGYLKTPFVLTRCTT